MKNKLIGLYQLITGVYGVFALILSFNKFALWQVIVGVVLFVIVGYAGYGLLNNIRNAYRLSMIMQAMQSIAVMIPGFIYLFTASAFVSLVYSNEGFKVASRVQVIDYTISFEQISGFSVQLFVVPLILFIVLFADRN